jgi:hypothetical protein
VGTSSLRFFEWKATGESDKKQKAKTVFAEGCCDLDVNFTRSISNTRSTETVGCATQAAEVEQLGDCIGSTAAVFCSARLAQPVKLYRTVRAMTDRSFVVLNYQGKVPAMASCAKCQRKFFTPSYFLS